MPEEKSGKIKSNALTVQKKELKKQEVERWLSRELPRGGAELGVSRNYMVRMAIDLSLTIDDLEIIAAIRRDFSTSIPAVKKLLNQGLTVEDVHDIYLMKEAILVSSSDEIRSTSLAQLIRFRKSIISPDTDADELGSILFDAHIEIKKAFPWIKYFDQSVRMICDIAEGYNISHLEAVIQIVQNQRIFRLNSCPDNEDDERLSNDEIDCDPYP